MSTFTNTLNLNAGNAQVLRVRASTLEQVFRKHFRLVYETALHVTGNPYDADDVVQNTFLQSGLPTVRQLKEESVNTSALSLVIVADNAFSVEALPAAVYFGGVDSRTEYPHEA